MAESRIGVVTVTYNSGAVIEGFMQSMMSQTYASYHLYIVDNASEDGTVAYLSNCSDARIRLIGNPDNRGIAAGNNQGIEAALRDGCDRVLLINNDTEFDPDLLAKMVAGAEQYGAQMLVPKIVYYDRPSVIWCAGGKFDRLEALGTVHCGEEEQDRGQYDTARVVEYSPTCCMLVDTEVFQRVGLMDEAYFVYYDDVDFCVRTMRAGIKLWYIPSTTVKHKVSSLTGGSKSMFTIRQCTRNKVYFIRKHFHPVAAVGWLILYQVSFWCRLFSLRDSPEVFRVKQACYSAGLKVPLESKS